MRKSNMRVVFSIIMIMITSCYSARADTPSPKVPENKKRILELNEVIKSSLAFHPVVEAARTELSSVDGELKTARGAFDPTFKVESQGYGLGDYSGTYVGGGVEVPLEYMGSKIITGYRRSGGSFPLYENYYETNQTGEARVGVEVPLLRDALIDKRRTGILKAKLQQTVALSNVEIREIEMSRIARNVYWDWAAAYYRREIIRNLLRVAEERDQQLKARVSQGDMAQFDLTDNVRTILQRKNQLLSATLNLQRTELELSLLLRDNNGEPQSVTHFIPPHSFPEPFKNVPDKEQTVERALAQRPEFTRFDTIREQNKLELELNDNQFLPRLDTRVVGARDYGGGSTSRDETELKLEMKVEIPLRTRSQEGRDATLQAKQREINLLRLNLRQRIATDIQDALIALSTAQERFVLAKREVAVALELEQGERKKLELGDSNLIFVNLREQASADAQIREVDSLLDFWKSYAQLIAVRGDKFDN